MLLAKAIAIHTYTSRSRVLLTNTGNAHTTHEIVNSINYYANCANMWLDLQKGSYTCNYKYLEIKFWNIQFNISWEWLELLLFKVIYCIYCTLDSYIAGFPAILDDLYWCSQYHQLSYRVGAFESRNGGQKTAKWLPLMSFPPPHATQSS